MLVFQQDIDKWLSWIEQGDITSSPNPAQGHVDDVDLTATTEADIQVAVTKTDRCVTHAVMEVTHRDEGETLGMEVKHQVWR